MNFTDKIAVIFKKKKGAENQDLISAAESFTDTLPVVKDYYLSLQGTLNEDLFSGIISFCV